MKLVVPAIVALNLAFESSALRLDTDASTATTGTPGTDSMKRFKAHTEAHELRNLLDLDDDGQVSAAEQAAMDAAIAREDSGQEADAVANYIKATMFDDFNHDDGDAKKKTCVTYQELLDAGEFTDDFVMKYWFKYYDLDKDACWSQAEFSAYLDYLFTFDYGITDAFDRTYGADCINL